MYVRLAALILTLCLPANGQLVFESDLAVARAKAQREGKWVFADFCRPACTECQASLRVWNSATIAPGLTNHFVLFQEDIDHGNVWRNYAKGHEGASLPLMVFMDPAGSTNDTYTGMMGATVFRIYLNREIAKVGPVAPPVPTVPVLTTNSAGVWLECTNCHQQNYVR